MSKAEIERHRKLMRLAGAAKALRWMDGADPEELAELRAQVLATLLEREAEAERLGKQVKGLKRYVEVLQEVEVLGALYVLADRWLDCERDRAAG